MIACIDTRLAAQMTRLQIAEGISEASSDCSPPLVCIQLEPIAAAADPEFPNTITDLVIEYMLHPSFNYLLSYTGSGIKHFLPLSFVKGLKRVAENVTAVMLARHSEEAQHLPGMWLSTLPQEQLAALQVIYPKLSAEGIRWENRQWISMGDLRLKLSRNEVTPNSVVLARWEDNSYRTCVLQQAGAAGMAVPIWRHLEAVNWNEATLSPDGELGAPIGPAPHQDPSYMPRELVDQIVEILKLSQDTKLWSAYAEPSQSLQVLPLAWPIEFQSPVQLDQELQKKVLDYFRDLGLQYAARCWRGNGRGQETFTTLQLPPGWQLRPSPDGSDELYSAANRRVAVIDVYCFNVKWRADREEERPRDLIRFRVEEALCSELAPELMQGYKAELRSAQIGQYLDNTAKKLKEEGIQSIVCSVQ